MIEIEDLDVRFGEFHAVRRASFAVGAGEAFGLVGESGSGKTTVLRAIAGLLQAWTGRITVDGEALGATSGLAGVGAALAGKPGLAGLLAAG